MPFFVTYVDPDDETIEHNVPISKATQECVFTSLKQVAVKVRDVKAHYPKLKVRVYHASLWEEN
jgi:hypothetical protein